ncbi:hypothetical protein MPH48_07075 [Lysinibacillus fusiformis]|uniref:ABC-three component system protein n=1 Tax=Lysinibacillus fusiformis TaxID=28031 RepID=UPI001F4EF344|nr:ABC-three component system protein [Lysinibacillus fusiformis]MCK1987872.1 hypothetical protein [Lysinibacillus fusiformis]
MRKFKSDNINAQQQTIGDNSNVINGHNNILKQFFNTFSPKTVTPSDIHKVCEILDGNLSENTDFTFTKNPDWVEKMNYNSLYRYRSTFEEYCMFYESVEEVFTSTAIDGNRLLRVINNIYKDELIDNPDLNSDKIVRNTINSLRIIVENSYKSTSMTSEHIEDVIISVVFFAFTRCKILEKPPENNN